MARVRNRNRISGDGCIFSTGECFLCRDLSHQFARLCLAATPRLPLFRCAGRFEPSFPFVGRQLSFASIPECEPPCRRVSSDETALRGLDEKPFLFEVPKASRCSRLAHAQRVRSLVEAKGQIAIIAAVKASHQLKQDSHAEGRQGKSS